MSEPSLESYIIDVPDYPEPGVIFKDITPLLDNPKGLAMTVDKLADHFVGKGITKIVGAEARGFLLGSAVAYRLNAGFVPARKPGKLPREVYSQDYALEYGVDQLEIHRDAMGPDDRVLIVDDLIATGGTAKAMGHLVEKAGASIVGFAVILELEYLHPAEYMADSFPQEIFSLIKVS